MTRMLAHIAACALACAPVFAQEANALAAKPSPARHVILCGSGGEEEFVGKFREWGRRLRDALVTRAGAAPEHVSLLLEAETESPPPDTTTSLDSIRALFARLAQSGPMGDVFVYLIGHGSYLRNESKFQIPGPDMTAEDLKGMLDSLPAKRIAVIDGTSASAGFVNVLSGPNRIICSATKSTTEVNAPEFMRLFIEAIEDGSADRNRDERISVREAAEQAAELTATYYSSATLIATEHSILDDNGDGLGTRLPVPAADPAIEPLAADATAPNLDGALADAMYIKDFSFPAKAPQELINGYLAALDEIKALKAIKGQKPETEYYAALEPLLLKAARTHRDIRAYAEPPGPESSAQ